MILKENFYLGDIPALPGIYIFRDKFSKIIYIGKTVSLRKRIVNYFQPHKIKQADPKLKSLINSIHSLEFKTVKNNDEAILLETKLIKEYSPYYNILMRDDKRFLMVKINTNEDFPKLTLARLNKNDSAKYFGPFPHGKTLKKTIEFISAYFKIRTCKTINPTSEDRKYCIASRIKKCSEPCINKISKEEYKKKVNHLLDVLNGQVKELTDNLTIQMIHHSEKQKYEKAAEIRDIIGNINSLFHNKKRTFKFASASEAIEKQALIEIKHTLKIPNIPNLIYAIDISNFGNDFAVSGVICFKDGKPFKKNYRRFFIRDIKGIDDFGMIKEVVKRHFLKLNLLSLSKPDLLLIDGGKGQLSAAIEALVEIKYLPIPVIGLAKKHEEIYLPNKKEPIVLKKDSLALRLLQNIRDETYRFSISYNRNIRSKKINESILDDISGIGPARKKEILKKISSISALKKYTPQELTSKVPSINLKMAQKILSFLNSKDLS